MFLLKKAIGFLLMPLPLSLIFLVLGVLFILLFKRRLLARVCFALGLCILLLAANRAASGLLCASLERRYLPAPVAAIADTSRLKTCTFVAVLGSGHGNADDLAASQQLSPPGRARLVEGLRLAILLPETRLIVSGPRMGADRQTHARVLADAAVELGFPRGRILEIDTARDTAEETAALARLVGGERVALVTSAYHMPRAMRLAKHAGLAAVPCPSDYLDRDGRNTSDIGLFAWDAESLSNSTRAWREYIGLVWTSLTGKSGT
jgi:uncharacterized SAM-binding protein YcdF (DUF218 family)